MRVMALFALVVMLPDVAPAQAPAGDDRWSTLDAYVGQAVRDWDVPGLAIAVVEGDSVAFAGGYGVRGLRSGRPVTTQTLFANASTTKAFTAMAVAMMVDEGRMRFDDPVSRHMPRFVLSEAYPTREVTIRDLLTHRVGFGDPGYLWYGVELGYPEMVGRLRFVDPATSFRARFDYNNVSYATAGVIAGTVYGSTWDALVRERILAPLGMTQTVTRGRDLAARDDVARPHDWIDGVLQEIPALGLVDEIAAAGAMYSSVMDMTRWVRFLLNEGHVEGRRLVSDTAFAELFTPQIIVPPDEFYPTARLTHPHFAAYGLGWFLQDYRGEFVAFHTGSIDGTVAIVGLLPERDAGLVVFANRDHAELRHALMFRVFDIVLGAPDRDWSTELRRLYGELAAQADERRRQAMSQRVTGTSPSRPLEEYAGTYADSLYGQVNVRLVGDHLELRRSPFLTADLEHWHYDVFRSAWRPRWLRPDLVSFRLGTDGKVAALEYEGAVLQRVQADAASTAREPG